MGLKLTKPCETCNGTGIIKDDSIRCYKGYSCYDCEKTGEVLSENGKELMEFLKNYFLPNLRSEIDFR